MSPLFRILTVFVVVLVAGNAVANTKTKRPMDTLKEPFDHAIAIWNAPSSGIDKRNAMQSDRLWETIYPVFDFKIISRLAVGKMWRAFSPEEKTRFVSVFSEYLRFIYIDKLQGALNDLHIEFVKESVKGSKALVWTRLQRKDLSVSITYRLRLTNGSWKIYDIMLEDGISVVKNYRVQFTSILKTKSPNQLIEDLEKKLPKHPAASSGIK